MIKHIIALLATVLALWAFWFMAEQDKKVERFKNIELLIQKTSSEKVKVANTIQPIEQNSATKEVKKEVKKEEDEAQKRLKALQERAGNIMAFKVSPLYKQKCSSCHGANGEGIIGPKLIGLSSDTVLKALEDFKSGKRKNYVMYGLLSKMNEEQLKTLAKEIGSFEAKLKASNK